MYRLDSVGLFGLPKRPLACDRCMNQLTALTRLSEYFPSRRVLPSISMAMPASAVMVVGYWPPWASQWPSGAWVRLSHSSPFSTTASTSTFFFIPASWAGAGTQTKATAAADRAAAGANRRNTIGTPRVWGDGTPPNG